MRKTRAQKTRWIARWAEAKQREHGGMSCLGTGEFMMCCGEGGWRDVEEMLSPWSGGCGDEKPRNHFEWRVRKWWAEQLRRSG